MLIQVAIILAIVATCARAIPIKVHEEVQYAAPQTHEQLIHYVPQVQHVQYSHEPQHHLQEVHEVEEHHHAHPKYEFKYGVKDTHTHDIKEQAEKRDGHKVEGYYKLVEPDGTTRTVHYTADKHTGFHAQVEKSGHAVHPLFVVPVKKVIYPIKKVEIPVKKVVYPVKYQSYEPVVQHDYSQDASQYTSSYSGEEASGGSNSYSSVSYGGASQAYDLAFAVT
ncbi:hypothetical protein L9F63_022455, partial [Diploptera punctata]